MSALFKATCLARDTASGSVNIQIKSIHPDSGNPEAETFFAMQILADFLRIFTLTSVDTDPSAAPALSDEIVACDRLEESWLRVNTSSYISSVVPIEQSDDGTKKDIVLRVTPTHPAWTEHCKVGATVDTASYVLGNSRENVTFAPAPPLTPIDRKAPIEVEENPFAGFEMKKPREHRKRDEEGTRRQRESEQQQQQPAPTSGVGFGGWAKPKTAEVDPWATAVSATSSTTTAPTNASWNFESSSFSGFGQNKPAEQDQAPDREMPFPKFSAVKYHPVLPIPDKDNLVLLPVLYNSFGGVSIGTIIKVNETKYGTKYIIYSEGEIMTSFASVNTDDILGRAALMKPRKRI